MVAYCGPAEPSIAIENRWVWIDKTYSWWPPLVQHDVAYQKKRVGYVSISHTHGDLQWSSRMQLTQRKKWGMDR